jgi:hypothetical protein
MLPVIRQSFIIVLVLLQLFAPLVHAHTGSSNYNEGLHVPGLELYRANQDATVSQNVNVDLDAEGMLVVVDAGIKNPQAKFVESVNINFALLPPEQLRISALPKSDCNFSPQSQSFSFRKFPATRSPRAPPAQ